MNERHIISFERGILYLRLRESLNTSTMEVSSTIAEITREGIHIVCADSRGEISSSSMRLTANELDRIEEGRLIVRRFWESNPLGNRTVLFECGHAMNWDEWNDDMNNQSNSHGMYMVPGDDTYYCFECESSTSIHRYSASDFS
jgi:hypothetical protein